MAFESDWAFLREAVPELQSYIISADIYRPLRARGGVQIPQLTIGNVLLSQARLSARSLAPEQKRELAEIDRQLDQQRNEWRANWEMKAAREFGSRLNLWTQYVRELRSDTRQQTAYFSNEVRNRAILQLLRPDAGTGLPGAEVEQVAMLDQVLRGLSQPGQFVWEPEVANGFPPEPFWFLYVKF